MQPVVLGPEGWEAVEAAAVVGKALEQQLELAGD